MSLRIVPVTLEAANEWLTHPTRQPGVRATHLPSCMGGWCPKRDHCALYERRGGEVSTSNLCERGQEDPVMPDDLGGKWRWVG